MEVAVSHRQAHHRSYVVWSEVLWTKLQNRDADMKKLRCAIYTRKSSEDGLEQEFNSLDAQREACAA